MRKELKRARISNSFFILRYNTLMRSAWVLASIIVFSFALCLRLVKVSEIPPALSWDEVSIGYNAYSILKTAYDEHGKFLPYDAFAGYGDYKPPLPIYLTVPSIALFGLTEFAVRLPSVLFGTGSVILLYFVIWELLRNRHAALAGSLSLTFSPWHINLSRVGFEANIGLFFVLLGVLLVLVARRFPRMWFVAWMPLVAAVYTFNSSRYFAPFIGLGLFMYSYKEIVKYKKIVFAGICIASITLLPIMPHLVSKEARLRFVEVNIFSDLGIIERSNYAIAREGNTWSAKILHNRRLEYARSFLLHYFDHFSPDYLFIKGDSNPKFSTQDVGQLYLVDLPFLLIGLYVAFFFYRKEALLLLFWLMTAIIPAAVARETPHALRTLNSLPVWHIFIGLGLATLFKQKTVRLVIIVGYALSVGYYLHNYYTHYPRTYSNEWQYGYKQAIEFTSLPENLEKKVYLSEYIGRAYMYTAFYTAFDPDRFVKMKKSYFDAAGFYHVDGFDRYIFNNAPPEKLEEDTLYIYPSGLVPHGVRVKKTIPLLNGQPVLSIFEKG